MAVVVRAERKKEQFMALVERGQLAELDALRVVEWASRAEINRQALEIALPIMREQRDAKLARLAAVAERAAVESVDYFVKHLVAGRQRVPQLEELEKMNRTQLRALLKP
jgi:hypothetical protein